MGINLINGGRSLRRGELRRRREIWIEIRIGDNEALLRDAIQQLRLLQILLFKAIIKDAQSGPEYGLGRALFGFSDPPRNSQARRKATFVVQLVLPLVANAVIDGDVWAETPFVLGVEAEIGIIILQRRISLGESKLAGSAANRRRYGFPGDVRAPAVRTNLTGSEARLQVLLGDLIIRERIESERPIETGQLVR